MNTYPYGSTRRIVSHRIAGPYLRVSAHAQRTFVRGLCPFPGFLNQHSWIVLRGPVGEREVGLLSNPGILVPKALANGLHCIRGSWIASEHSPYLADSPSPVRISWVMNNPEQMRKPICSHRAESLERVPDDRSRFGIAEVQKFG